MTLKFVSPTWRNWLKVRLAKTNEKIPLSELRASFENETKIKLTQRAYEIGLKIIGKEQVIRHEQLYWYPKHLSENKRTSHRLVRMVGVNTNSQPIHSSHRYRFSITYKGVQPKDGLVRAWGRTRKQIQVEYNFGKDMKLQVFSKRIIVMLANPEGTTTQEQQIEARKSAFLAILGFCKERKLELEGNLEKKLGTHHVLEFEPANKAFQNAVGQYAKEIEQRTGSLVFGDSSHNNQMEHQGGGTSLTQGQQAALSFEWLLWKFPQQFAQFSGGMEDYNKNLKLHIEVMEEIRDYIKELRGMKK